MAPLSCLAAPEALRACQDAYPGLKPPPSASGKSTLQIMKDLPATVSRLANFSAKASITTTSDDLLRKVGTLVKRTMIMVDPAIYRKPAGAPSKPRPSDAERAAQDEHNKKVLKILLPCLAVLFILFLLLKEGCCCCTRPPKGIKIIGGGRKSVKKSSNRHDYEYRSQDRANRSLRWKTLKKWFGKKESGGGGGDGKGEGGDKGVEKTSVERVESAKRTWYGWKPRSLPGKEVVDGGEKDVEKGVPADIEALNGVTIRPMKEWSITSDPSPSKDPPE